MHAGSHSSLGSSWNGAPHFRLGLITAVNVIKDSSHTDTLTGQPDHSKVLHSLLKLSQTY